MKRPTLREVIPAIIVGVFLAAGAALVLELLIAAAAGKAADPVATTVLGGLLTACLPILGGFWLRDSARPPSPPEERPKGGLERSGDEESDRWNEEHGWLEVVGWRPRWRLS